eukprot:TRINITY_DN4196_c0_g1_i5.p1 TRINITY_DN4196_c0_g1~~TRINITY_DN4196_c0_g1_i5.p1  ORF type:complete len:603 (-),score=109.17 TRINITY_DN4196_c0_g1_i5:109-1917(-)
MDAGITAAEKLIEFIQLMLDMRDATIGNVSRCRHLFNRAEGLKQTLEDNEVRRKLHTGSTPPVCLTNLLDIIKMATSFIEKYGKKSKFGQFLNSFNIEQDFNVIETRMTSAVTDLNLFIGLQMLKGTSSENNRSTTAAAPSPSSVRRTRREYDGDVAQALQEDDATSLVIRITPNIEQDSAIGLALMQRLPGLWFLYCETVEEFLDILKSNPFLKTHSSRVRIISNRTLNGKSTGAQQLIDVLKKLDKPFPTMIYCSDDGVKELKAKRGKELKPAKCGLSNIWYSIFLTANQNVVENFALMSRLLWVDHNDNEENRKIQLQIQEQGIQVIRALSTQEAVNYIKSNPGLGACLSNFRMMTNRTRPEGPAKDPVWNSEAGLQFIDIMRCEFKISSPALIFTAKQNVITLQEVIRRKDYVGVAVTSVEQEALKFCASDESDSGITRVTQPREPLTGLFSSERREVSALMNSTVIAPIKAGGRLYFEQLSCTNLAPKDRNGKSDPFIVIKSSSGGSIKTMTIMKTLNPVWETSYSLPCSRNDTILFDVWDWDLTGDDFEGRASFALDITPSNTTCLFLLLFKLLMPVQNRFNTKENTRTTTTPRKI